MSLSVTPIGNLAATNIVAAWFDGETRSRTFVTYPAGVYTSSPTNPNGLPTVTSVSQVTITDPTGSSQKGGWKVVLAPAAGDTTNISSPMQFFFDEEVVFITASTSTG